jgi:large subunit ribosomal protein L21
MKYAIVESGGKQYKATEGFTIEVDLLQNEVGEQIKLDLVYLVVDEENIMVGTPDVKGAVVTTTVVSHFKGPKIIIFKYKPKKKIRVKTGHRQQYTKLLINSIEVK